MIIYLLTESTKDTIVSLEQGEPFRVLYNDLEEKKQYPGTSISDDILAPWGVAIEDLDLSLELVDETLTIGKLAVAVQYKKRRNPIRLGEFFDQEMSAEAYRSELAEEFEPLVRS